MTDGPRLAWMGVSLALCLGLLPGGVVAEETEEPEEGAPEDDDDSAAAEPSEEPSAEPSEEPQDAPPVPDVPEIPDMSELPPLPPLEPSPGAGAPPSGPRILPSEPIVVPPPVEVTLRGFVGFDWQPYLKPLDGAVDQVLQLRVAPRIEARFQFLRAAAEVELRHDFVDPGRNRLIVREALVGLRIKGLRFEAGALLPRWGVMDTASPTDNVVAWDYEDLFAPQALPVPGFLLGFARGPVSAEAIVLPAFRPSRYRGGSVSRWDITRFLPATQEVPVLFSTVELENQYNTFLPEEIDGDAPLLRGFEVGGRVDLSLPVLDLGVSFLATRDRLPTYTAYRTRNATDGDGDGQPDVLIDGFADLEITAHHRRLYVPGVDLAAVLGPVVLKGEAAFFATEDPSGTDCLVDDPYVKYAFGVELVLSNLIGDFDLALRAQYNGDVALPTRDEPGPQRISDNLSFPDGSETGNYERGCLGVSYPAENPEPSQLDYATGYTGTPEQRHPYQHGFFWNANFGFTRALSLDLRGFVDTAGDALLLPRFEALLVDRLRLGVGALIVLGTGDDTIFTPYGNNHRLEFSARYDF